MCRLRPATTPRGVPLVDGTTTGGARIRFGGHAQRAREGLENRLALVMGVVAAQVVDVQRHLRMVDEALEELVRQVDVELADHRAGERHVPFEARSAGEIHHHARQRLVERHVGMAVAADASLVADRCCHRLAESDADVLDRVMGVDVQVALGLDRQVDRAVAGDLVEHVIEERTPVDSCDLPLPSRLTLTLIWVSVVLRSTVPVRAFIGALAVRRGIDRSRRACPPWFARSLRAADARACEFLIRMPRCRRPSNTVSARAASPTRNRTKFAAVSKTPSHRAVRRRRPTSRARSARSSAAWPSSTSR